MTNPADRFYLGRIFDPNKGEVTQESLLYDPDDLTTHAVCVGMTGSGKTGLCIDLLEEAALQGIPALMIDPKGDITNALLHFPQLRAEDFAPWVNPDQARREDKTIEQAAADAAALWTKGLAKWDIGPDRIQALKDAAHFAIYTPGSEAGIPVNILASLKAPGIPWDENREMLAEKISGIVMGLLLRAKTTGTPSARAVIRAGAMPEISAVNTRVGFTCANRRANSSPHCSIRRGST